MQTRRKKLSVVHADGANGIAHLKTAEKEMFSALAKF